MLIYRLLEENTYKFTHTFSCRDIGTIIILHCDLKPISNEKIKYTGSDALLGSFGSMELRP